MGHAGIISNAATASVRLETKPWLILPGDEREFGPDGIGKELRLKNRRDIEKSDKAAGHAHKGRRTQSHIGDEEHHFILQSRPPTSALQILRALTFSASQVTKKKDRAGELAWFGRSRAVDIHRKLGKLLEI